MATTRLLFVGGLTGSACGDWALYTGALAESIRSELSVRCQGSHGRDETGPLQLPTSFPLRPKSGTEKEAVEFRVCQLPDSDDGHLQIVVYSWTDSRVLSVGLGTLRWITLD